MKDRKTSTKARPPDADDAPAREARLQGLVHELQVHQLELELQNEALRNAHTELLLAAAVFAHSYDGIMVCDRDELIVDVNPAFTRITGYAREEAIGRKPSLLASGLTADGVFEAMRQSLDEHRCWRGEIVNRRKGGALYPQAMSIAAVADAAGRVSNYVAVFSDISKLKFHEAELLRIANYDTLTGLPNRRLFSDRLQLALARSRRSGNPLAICYLDLDGFKDVNDRHGHAAGDQLLMTIARNLSAALRAEDTVARLGGDEFALLIDVEQDSHCEAAMERVLAATRLPVAINGQNHSVSGSLGLTIYPADDADAETLLRHADQAMYLAKEAGKNGFHRFDLARDQGVKAVNRQRQRLEQAMQGGELLLHYQPKVDLSTGRVMGAEALVRWQHPEHGLLLPGAFLGILQNTSLEVVLGEWVIDHVLTQIGTWRAAGLRLGASANISPYHLLQPDFAERLAALLQCHPDIDAALLELEILESAALSDATQAAGTLAKCRALGVKLSLDDFGTGYSSLALLRQLPLDVLKVDQTFVSGMLEDPSDQALVEGVIHLAQAFGCDVIAEGVETPEHGAVLLAKGCSVCQGYGIARPMPAELLPAWSREWSNSARWTRPH
ncbi:bifunctional diguanylate cyclase/phosphodiesterase [Pelomonas sp. KK5]|uniref:putative bifunctional diguanylate cyclase/phosphodiesterase n=1 Tax=Pelomonas sp. KK5 TaxID=1855730 RepID=UPI00097C7A2A|nr:EAL domain-containing protein [Pelomonas sp. KK5]